MWGGFDAPGVICICFSQRLLSLVLVYLEWEFSTEIFSIPQTFIFVSAGTLFVANELFPYFQCGGTNLTPMYLYDGKTQCTDTVN